MKKGFFILSLTVLPFLVGAQDFVDNLFNKYSGKEDFTSIVVSKDLLDFAFSIDKSDSTAQKLSGKISDLKILVSNNKSANADGFSTDVLNGINKNDYISLMEVLDGKNKVNFYVKKENDKIVHLLLIALTDEDKVLLSLKGRFTMNDLVELGKDSHDGNLHHLSYLKKLEKQ